MADAVRRAVGAFWAEPLRHRSAPPSRRRGHGVDDLREGRISRSGQAAPDVQRLEDRDRLASINRRAALPRALQQAADDRFVRGWCSTWAASSCRSGSACPRLRPPRCGVGDRGSKTPGPRSSRRSSHRTPSGPCRTRTAAGGSTLSARSARRCRLTAASRLHVSCVAAVSDAVPRNRRDAPEGAASWHRTPCPVRTNSSIPAPPRTPCPSMPR